MEASAVVIDRPKSLNLRRLELRDPGEEDVVVETMWSGISTGTERQLYDGTMPAFPGMGYPLVPGYEAVGLVTRAKADTGLRPGTFVFVPGARCYRDAASLFGASASRLVTAASRVTAVDPSLGESATLLSLAATAYHALTLPGTLAPDLVIGHGMLGRLVVRIAMALGNRAPCVWETNPQRRGNDHGYRVSAQENHGGETFASILDASGDPAVLDQAIGALAPGGSLTLAGFYGESLAFRFAPAFMREAQIRIAAEFKPADIAAVCALIADGKLSLDGLITHRADAADAQSAYAAAFSDPACIKMVLDWRTLQ